MSARPTEPCNTAPRPESYTRKLAYTTKPAACKANRSVGSTHSYRCSFVPVPSPNRPPPHARSHTTVGQCGAKLAPTLAHSLTRFQRTEGAAVAQLVVSTHRPSQACPRMRLSHRRSGCLHFAAFALCQYPSAQPTIHSLGLSTWMTQPSFWQQWHRPACRPSDAPMARCVSRQGRTLSASRWPPKRASPPASP